MPRSAYSSRNSSPMRSAFSGAASLRVENLEISDDMHPVIHADRVAVVTGAANGIGRAAAREFARLGLKIAIADNNEPDLAALGKELQGVVGEANVLILPTDVSKLDQVVALRDRVYDAWGEVAVLLNNAGIAPKGASWQGLDNWHKIFDVNLFGVINVQQTFVPSMIHQENQAVIINTGSKQGITNPPGNPAYNASKAAVKSLTESLAYELRERAHSNVTAHLFIPGWTHTNLTAPPPPPPSSSSSSLSASPPPPPSASSVSPLSSSSLSTFSASSLSPSATPLSAGSGAPSTPKPRGAWSAEETVLYMLDKVREGDFYILVPDNETKREVDQLRIMWSAADVAEGRPALSRWHGSYRSLFEEYMRESLAQLE